MGYLETGELTFFANGKPIGPIKASLEPTFTLDSEGNMKFLSIDLVQDREYTVSFTPKFPHTNRKTFIRRLQKLGYSKKEAKKIAWKTQKNKHTSYSYTIFLYSVGALPHPKDRVWSI
jgi:hypothetical protein